MASRRYTEEFHCTELESSLCMSGPPLNAGLSNLLAKAISRVFRVEGCRWPLISAWQPCTVVEGCTASFARRTAITQQDTGSSTRPCGSVGYSDPADALPSGSCGKCVRIEMLDLRLSMLQ